MLQTVTPTKTVLGPSGETSSGFLFVVTSFTSLKVRFNRPQK